MAADAAPAVDGVAAKVCGGDAGTGGDGDFFVISPAFFDELVEHEGFAGTGGTGEEAVSGG